MSRFRVMIVDDEEDLRTIQRMTLRPKYETIEAFDGLDALEKLEWVEPDFVILDVAMPLMSGLEACRAIRNHPGFRDVPVLFLSVLGQKDVVKEAFTSGANVYITKPFDPDKLLEAIDRLAQMADTEPRLKHQSVEELEAMYSAPKPVVPVAEPAAPPETEPAETKTETPADKAERPIPRVMIVDDDQDMIDLLTATLKRDFEVVSAMDGVEAIEKIIIFQPDLFLLDAMMPRKSGYQLCESLRRNYRYRHTPIIFVSARTSQPDRERCISAGADGFIAKPFNPVELRETVLKITRSPDFLVHPKRITTDISYPDASDELV